MKVFAIGDLHLPGSLDKTMDMFGSHWEGHWDKIRMDWQKRVQPTDLVLLPGDISWAMKLEEAGQDLAEIHEMPGTKVMIRGNHDFWWSSLSKMFAALPPSILPLQNQAHRVGDFVVCGTRGWTCPSDAAFKQEDKKIYDREVGRLELSLKAAQKLSDQGTSLLAMIHYPPFNERREESGFTQLFREYGVRQVVYGHLHGKSLQFAFEGELNGVSYTLVSCDHLGFKLKSIV